MEEMQVEMEAAWGGHPSFLSSPVSFAGYSVRRYVIPAHSRYWDPNYLVIVYHSDSDIVWTVNLHKSTSSILWGRWTHSQLC